MLKKTIGGDRLGSGNKMQAALHNYERSTHDLGNAWRSSMAPGVLTPFYKKICTNGDTWSINLSELIRTMPAVGPCFGSYKLQLDVFEVPIRLYNGILHNNMTKIGMDMSKVKLPKMTLYHNFLNRAEWFIPNEKLSQVAPDSLVHYMGIKGVGYCEMSAEDKYVELSREFNAIPILAYYDIFKNYYSNKQEEYAYVIDHDIKELENTNLIECYYKINSMVDGTGRDSTFSFEIVTQELIGGYVYGNNITPAQSFQDWEYWSGNKLLLYPLTLKFNGDIGKDSVKVKIAEKADLTNNAEVSTLNNYLVTQYYDDHMTVQLTEAGATYLRTQLGMELADMIIITIEYIPAEHYSDKIKLQRFPLSNIDDMRIWLLSNTQLGTELNINNFNKLPYNANCSKKTDNNSGCKNNMAGLVVKTYQSDMFNNWLSKEWIDGINGINAISAVSIEDSKFTIDALNLAHKVYNMLNRIAVSGGTYEDWQEAVYGEDAIRRAESPIYCGGASGIITFEEVVSTADTETASAGDQPLGSIAGKGVLTNAHGGNIEIHIKEPSYIIGIASITPLLDYYLGNDFDMTELDSLNDLHKPELDEIGFQDLMIERAAWWGKVFDNTEDTPSWHDYAGGKLPAWIEYMTSVNEVHGDFADRRKLGFMVLTRDFEMGYGSRNNTPMPDDTTPLATVPVRDWTTYINPTAYNYQFANTKLNAQNFWVQIGINAQVRRKISAKLIPNL